jgi:hypothetical protein
MMERWDGFGEPDAGHVSLPDKILRFDLNYDLAKSLSRREKARLGRGWLGAGSTC